MKSILKRVSLFVITTLVFVSCMPPQGGDQAKGGNSSNIMSLIFLPLMILVFWLFFIRPQSKRAKNQKKFIEEIGKGDKIVTIAGMDVLALALALVAWRGERGRPVLPRAELEQETIQIGH